MNKSLFSIIPLAMASAFISCSSDNNDASNASSEYINSVRVTVEYFKPETPTTRTAYTVDGSGFNFSWADGDALGVYPVGGDQVKFPISAGGGSKSASFDGGSWKLRSNLQYAAYYPFSTANSILLHRLHFLSVIQVRHRTEITPQHISEPTTTSLVEHHSQMQTVV